MWRKKTYFYASEFFDRNTGRKSMVFIWQNNTWIHRAGGWPEKVNFVLDKLVKKRGAKRGCQIYQAFNDALLEVSKERVEKRDFPKWVLVMFNKDDDYNPSKDQLTGWKVNENIHEGESRLQETWEGKEESSSST